MRARRDRHIAAQALPGDGKPWYRQLTTKIAGTIAVLVGLTTLVGNVLNLDERRQKAMQPPPAAAPAAPRAAAAGNDEAPQAAAARKLALGIERIVVVHDGTPGTTDWRFTVEAAGQPVFAFQQDDLDDTPGRNIALPKQATATLRLKPDASVPVVVRGWRLSRFRVGVGAPDATGTGTLAGDGSDLQVDVAATDAGDGEFRFYFAADPQ